MTGAPADEDEAAGEGSPDDQDTTAADDAEPFPHPLGGGSYELSDGSHVRGKAKALAAQAELDVAAEAA